MAAQRKIDFAALEWDSPAPGIRQKIFERDGKRVRLVELEPMPERPDWCLNGHTGCVLAGELEIEFADETITYQTGDVFIIGSGEREKHIPRPVGAKVVLFVSEDA
jgi:quercetin dioxygenase-like cupin family protein